MALFFFLTWFVGVCEVLRVVWIEAPVKNPCPTFFPCCDSAFLDLRCCCPFYIERS